MPAPRRTLLRPLAALPGLAAVLGLAALPGLAGCDRAEPETYLVPDGFAGTVHVVQGRPEGEPARVEDGRRIYAVPASGVLATQATANTGTTDERVFYVRPDGSRREITEQLSSTIPDTPASRADTAVVVYRRTTGSLGADDVPVQSFDVGTRAQILDAPDRSALLAPYTRPEPPPRQVPAE